MKKIVKEYVCESCDSEFKLSYIKEMVANIPECCPFCGEALEDEGVEDHDDDTNGFGADEEH